MEEQIKEQEAKLAELAREQKEKADSINRFQGEIETAVTIKKKADEEANEAILRVEECKKRVEEQEAKLPPLIEEEKELTIVLQKAKDEAKQLAQDLADLKKEAHEGEIAMEKFIIDNRKAEKEKKNEFEFEITELETKKSFLIDELAGRERYLTAKQTEVDAVEAQVAPLQASIASLKEEIARLDTLLEKNQDAIPRSISTLNETILAIETAKTELVNIQDAISEAKILKTQAENELSTVKAELDGQLAIRIQIGQQREDLNIRETYLKDLYQKAGIPW
jgi:hypothetical protein